MSYIDPSGDAHVGTLDGSCLSCGAPARRMGWLNSPERYWLMCTASGLQADESKYGRCDLPTAEQARRRLAAEASE